jgi:hypothetical protein
MQSELQELYTRNHIQALADSNHRAAAHMQRIGGGFASALGLAYQRGDRENQARILGAFADLFEKYRELALEDSLRE